MSCSALGLSLLLLASIAQCQTITDAPGTPPVTTTQGYSQVTRNGAAGTSGETTGTGTSNLPATNPPSITNQRITEPAGNSQTSVREQGAVTTMPVLEIGNQTLGGGQNESTSGTGVGGMVNMTTGSMPETTTEPSSTANVPGESTVGDGTGVTTLLGNSSPASNVTSSPNGTTTSISGTGSLPTHPEAVGVTTSSLKESVSADQLTSGLTSTGLPSTPFGSSTSGITTGNVLNSTTNSLRGSVTTGSVAELQTNSSLILTKESSSSISPLTTSGTTTNGVTSFGSDSSEVTHSPTSANISTLDTSSNGTMRVSSSHPSTVQGSTSGTTSVTTASRLSPTAWRTATFTTRPITR